MCADVDHGVFLMIVRQIGGVCAAGEREFQHFHPRQLGFGEELAHVVGQKPEILGDELCLRERFLHCADEFDPRAFDPFAVFGGRLVRGNAPEACQRAEVIDADGVEPFGLRRHALFPPCKIVPLHFVPVVQRRTPKLPLGGKIIRGNARNGLGTKVAIQKEQFLIRPHVSRVVGNVDRQVADDL